MTNRLDTVCKGIVRGENSIISLRPGSDKLDWAKATKAWKDEFDNPIYKQLDQVSITDVLAFAQSKTSFLEAFSVHSSNNKSRRPASEDLFACLFGIAGNFGISKFAKNSDRDEGKLRTIKDNYLRMETLSEANDLISNATGRLPIFHHYTIDESAPFASIDGQKFLVKINTHKARFSSKNFGTEKGVSSMSMITNHVPVNTVLNSANQYEGHYVFDLVYNNTSDIQPHHISTDQHGVNRVNFAILDLFGYKFSPRYAKIKRVFFELFEVVSGNEWYICLKKTINGGLIINEWEEIQRIICSLARKNVSQATIIQKLSQAKKYTRTLKALHEYDRLIKCLYVLEYIDDESLRQFVQQALNRGESYHSLRRSISSINGDRFIGGQDYSVEIANECARLIANSIVFFNSCLLSNLLKRYESIDNQEAIDLITRLSPVGWSYIQFNGKYIFESGAISVEDFLSEVDVATEDKDAHLPFAQGLI